MVWLRGLGIGVRVLLVLSPVFGGVLEGGPRRTRRGGGRVSAVAGDRRVRVGSRFHEGADRARDHRYGGGGHRGAGAATGVGAARLARGSSRALMRDGSAPAPRGEDLTGTPDTAVTAIPAGGCGEVAPHPADQPRRGPAPGRRQSHRTALCHRQVDRRTHRRDFPADPYDHGQRHPGHGTALLRHRRRPRLAPPGHQPEEADARIRCGSHSRRHTGREDRLRHQPDGGTACE